MHTAKGPWNLELKAEILNPSFICLYGDSGSGKTTILRMLAGLERPDSGRITVDGKIWFEHQKIKSLAPQKRKIGYVSQKYLLFPSMTVRQNLEYAQTPGEENFEIDTLLRLIKLQKLQDKKAKELSGGQQQRVAFARALVQKSKLLLLDEPFSGLDNHTRNELQLFLKKYQKENGVTIIMASHDQTEVGKLADRVLHIQPFTGLRDKTPTTLFNMSTYKEKGMLQGIILKISEDQTTIDVQIGNNLIKLKINLKGSQEFKVGQTVFWNPKNNHITTDFNLS